jgi:hypothetical protein
MGSAERILATVLRPRNVPLVGVQVYDWRIVLRDLVTRRLIPMEILLSVKFTKYFKLKEPGSRNIDSDFRPQQARGSAISPCIRRHLQLDDPGVTRNKNQSSFFDQLRLLWLTAPVTTMLIL